MNKYIGCKMIEARRGYNSELHPLLPGEEICMGKIKDKIWELLGFMLQSAANGVNN